MKNSRGFTLIELVLCMLVISILAVVAYPSNVKPSSVDSAARRILSDLRTAQQLAVTTGTTHGFKNNTNKQYQVYVQTPGTYAQDPVTRQNYLLSFVPQYKDSSFAGNYQVEFDSLGRPTMGGGTVLSVTDGQITKSITITANTGAIYLQ